MNFSIVIPTCNRHEQLFQALGKLAHYLSADWQRQSGLGVEVIVADDNRDSPLQPLLASKFPDCIYVEAPHRGPAACRNKGALLASGEWLVFLDDDCIPEPGLVEAYAAHRADADVLEGKTSPCGVRDRADMDCPVNETGGYLWSCNFAIRREVFRDMGGFDEGFPGAAYEDMDLYFRLLDANKVVKFVPSARVLHPWRIAKGADFIRAKAASGERLRTRHPARVPPRRLLRRIRLMLRFLGKYWVPDVIQFKGRGSLRSLYLHLVSMRLEF